MKRVSLLLLFLLSAGSLYSEETLPPPPKQYFNDYAGACQPATVTELNARLEQFERDSSNQILVAVYPKMTSDSSIEDFTVRVAESWKVGQKERDNGAVLFVFIQDRKMYLQVGYGLEGALPDARAKQIIENEIVPQFRKGYVDDGLKAGVAAILASIKGEYSGTGRTQGELLSTAGDVGWLPLIFPLIIVLIFIFMVSKALGSKGGRMIHSGGGSSYHGGWSGGGGFGGGSSGGGGGGFSGGGGSFGGGGAGGSW